MSQASEVSALILTKNLNLDEEIKNFAHQPMANVVYQNEFGIPRLGLKNSEQNAKQWLAAQMYTDAVFNQDIRVIQSIINRIDGGLPKDVDVNSYQTLFGDCMNEVLSMDVGMQLKVLPTDSVMMALCKSLFDLAASDIYHSIKTLSSGEQVSVKKKPSAEQKQAKDAAQRMVLERAGGRKSATLVAKTTSKVEEADWIKGVLPE